MPQAQLSLELEPAPAPAAAPARVKVIIAPPRLLVAWTPFWPSFLQNLSDFVARRDGAFVPANVRPGQFWPDVFVQRPMPWKELAQSGVLHVLAAVLIALTGSIWLGRQEVTLQDPLTHTTIAYYQTEAFMPAVKTAAPKVSPRARSKHDPVKAVQEIISVPSDADNSEQTIANLPHPEIIRQTVPLPNMISMPAPKFAAEAPKLTAPAFQFKPALPQVEGLREVMPERVATNDTPIEVRGDNAVDAPKLELQSAAKPADLPTPAAPSAPPPSIDSASVHSPAAAQLLVLNARPSPPSSEIRLPDGSRKGVFATSPLGREGAAGTPGVESNVRLLTEIKTGGAVPSLAGAKTDETPGKELPAGIHISGPKDNPELASAITPGVPQVRVQRAIPRLVLDAPSAVRPMMAASVPATKVTPPSEDRRPKDEVFGTKRVYQMQVNLPNLASAGGSWIIRFAEMERSTDPTELSTPVVTTQVDPAYPQSLQSEGVQGNVVLYAVIHTDGTVGAIKVLHGIHEKLDDNAMKALSRWKFRPATKRGDPVEIEAVVQIPFYTRRAALR